MIYAYGRDVAQGYKANASQIYKALNYGDDENDHIAVAEGIAWYKSVFPNDEPDFEPGFLEIQVMLDGYSAKRDIGGIGKRIESWMP